MASGGPSSATRLWALTPEGATVRETTGLAVNCTGAETASAPTVCAAYDGVRTRIVTIDPRDNRIAPAGWLPGRFFPHGEAAAGYATGWWNTRIVVLSLATLEAVEDGNDGRARSVAAADHALGVAIPRGRHTTVRLYTRP